MDLYKLAVFLVVIGLSAAYAPNLVRYRQYNQYDDQYDQYEGKDNRYGIAKFVPATYLPYYGQFEHYDVIEQKPHYGRQLHSRDETDKYGIEVTKPPPRLSDMTPYQLRMVVLMSTVAGTPGGSSDILDSVRA